MEPVKNDSPWIRCGCGALMPCAKHPGTTSDADEWRLVPVEPTLEMRSLAQACINRGYTASTVWEVMLAAAPARAPAACVVPYGVNEQYASAYRAGHRDALQAAGAPPAASGAALLSRARNFLIDLRGRDPLWWEENYRDVEALIRDIQESKG